MIFTPFFVFKDAQFAIAANNHDNTDVFAIMETSAFWFITPYILTALTIGTFTLSAYDNHTPIIADKCFYNEMRGNKYCRVFPVFGGKINSPKSDKVYRQRKIIFITIGIITGLSILLIKPAITGRYELTANGITRYGAFGSITNEYPAEQYQSVTLDLCSFHTGRSSRNSFCFDIVTHTGKTLSFEYHGNFCDIDSVRKFKASLSDGQLEIKNADKAEKHLSTEFDETTMDTIRDIFDISN